MMAKVCSRRQADAILFKVDERGLFIYVVFLFQCR